MPDKDFEKQVQEKMGELQFAPSDAVWQKVEKEIAERKKRRLFLWLPLALLLLGGSAWLYNYKANNKLNNQISKENTTKNTSSKKDIGLPEKNEPAGDGKTETEKIVNKKGNLPLKNDSTVINNEREKNNTAAVRKVGGIIPVVSVSGAVKNNSGTNKLKSGYANTKKKDHLNNSPVSFSSAPVINKSKKLTNNSEKSYGVVEQSAAGTQDLSSEKTAANTPTVQDQAVVAAQEPVSKSIVIDSIKAENNVIDTSVLAKKEAGPDSGAVAVKTAQHLATSKKITFGMTAGAGISNIVAGLSPLFAVHNTSASSYYNSVPSSNLNNGTTTIPVVSKPSDTKQGLTFGAGVFVNRKLSNNWRVTATVQYNYYSAKIAVGQKVDSANTVASGGNGATTTVSNYYRVSPNDSYNYTNAYHFIGISPAVEKQLGSKSRFSLNMGFTVSQLIASNALQYSTQKNIYYKDNSLFNKTQLGLFAGVNYQLLRKKTLFEIGPQISYGLTNLFKSDLYGNGHVFFVALSARWFFHKK